MSELNSLQADGIEYFSAVTAGVLQGSPLRGALFITAVDSLVAELVVRVPRAEGLARACAGDTPRVLGNIRLLGDLASVFSNAEVASGLALHPAKGAVVPRGPGIGCAGFRPERFSTLCRSGAVQCRAAVMNWRERCRRIVRAARPIQADAR